MNVKGMEKWKDEQVEKLLNDFADWWEKEPVSSDVLEQSARRTSAMYAYIAGYRKCLEDMKSL